MNHSLGKQADKDTHEGHWLDISTKLMPLKLFEIDYELPDTRSEYINKIRWIIRIRFIINPVIALLMVFTGWQGITQQQLLTRSSLIAIGITALISIILNIAYYFALRRQRNLRAFVILQLGLDVILFTSYIYRTGGVVSPLTFLYLLPIIAGSILVSGVAALNLALWSSLCYMGIAVFEASGVIEHISYFVALDKFARKWSYVLLMLIVNPFAFFTIAAISSFLMKEVHAKTIALTDVTVKLDKKTNLLSMLYQASRAGVDAKSNDEVIDRLARILVEGLNLDRVLFYVVNEEVSMLILTREFYHPRLGSELDTSKRQLKIPLQEDAGITAYCAIHRKAANVSDPSNHPLVNKELAAVLGMNPFAVAPMVAQGELIGVLGVDRKSKFGEIDEDSFKVLIAFADQAAATLHRARLEINLKGANDG